MSRSALCIFLLVAVAGAHGQQPVNPQSPPPAAAPTLKETTDWIQPHLSGLSHTSRQTIVSYVTKKGKPPKEVSRQAINTQETVTLASFDGCSLNLGQLIKGDDYTVVVVSQVPFNQLLQASWKTDTLDTQHSTNGEQSTVTTVNPGSVIEITLDRKSVV